MGEILKMAGENWQGIADVPVAVWFILLAIMAAVGVGLWRASKAISKAEVAGLNAAISSLNERIKHRDEEIAHLKDRSAESKAQLTERDGRINVLEVRVKDRDKLIKDLEEEGIDRFSQVMILTDELKQARADLEAANSKSIAVEFVDGEANPFAKKFDFSGVEGSRAKKPAGAKRNLFDLQKAIEPRRLNDDQKAAIKLSLKGLGARISIVTAMNADDANGLRDDLREAFGAAGWKVETLTSMSTYPSRAGLELVVNNPQGLTAMETRLHEALFAADLPHDLIRATTMAEAELRIVKRQR